MSLSSPTCPLRAVRRFAVCSSFSPPSSSLAAEAFAARGVENVVVAAARVDAERTGIGLEHGLHDRHAALLRGLGAQGVDEVGVALAEGLAHLRVEVVNVEVGHAGHQERAHHRHERGDEQQHDEH